MATVTERRLITAEEFQQMPPPPDGSKVELVRGELVKVCRPGFEHGLIQLRIGGILDQYGRPKKLGRAVVETGVRTDRGPDTVRGPDVSYWSAERLPFDQVPKGYPPTAPDLAVEVLSPSNRMDKIGEKMGEYFRQGVRMVWIVDPEDRTVIVHRSLDDGRLFHENQMLQVEDVLAGFSCKVAEFFG